MMRIFSLVLMVTLLAACSSDEPDVPAEPSAAGAPVAEAQVPAPDAPFAPMTSRDGQSQGSAIVAPGAIFTLPAAWISEPPSSGMRLAQARILGDAGEGQLTVFYFGVDGGGGVDSNLDRWIGQVEIDPGSEPRRDTFSHDAFRTTWIEVEGALKPGTMGTGPATAQPGSRLLAAVVEGPQGPWFFKATGPSATLAAERNAFLEMLKSAATHG